LSAVLVDAGCVGKGKIVSGRIICLKHRIRPKVRLDIREESERPQD